MKPYAIISDPHLHKWQAFSFTLDTGVNSRLQLLINEIERVSKLLKHLGGNTIYVAGDVFHVRGNIAPSVLNPVIEIFKKLVESGFVVRMISGNHDLEGKNSEKLGSAITSLEGVGVDVCHDFRVFEDDKVIMIPWFDRLDDLRAEIKSLSDSYNYKEYTLIIHAPLNGVINGLPDNGLSVEEVKAFGFKRVFAGHYHNHKFLSNDVISIGALAHHTWSDVGSNAGFIIINQHDGVDFYTSNLPQFIDVDMDKPAHIIESMANGNYVRAKVPDTKMSEVVQLRDWLIKSNAKGVIIQSMKKPEITRDATQITVSAGASVEQSVADYVGANFSVNVNCKEILKRSQEILARASI